MEIRKNLLLGSLLLILMTMSVYAQEKNKDVEKLLTNLSPKQQRLLKEQQVLLDKTRILFKENLTKEQLSLLNNRNVSIAERTKLLRQSLSSQQRNMIRSNRDLLKTKRSMFRQSLSKKQKMRLRRFLLDRRIDDRRRLVRRLRRLIRDNMD